MKKILFFSILSGALLLFASAQGQYKYIYKPKTTSSNSNTIHQFSPKSSAQKTTIPVYRAGQQVANKHFTRSNSRASQPASETPSVNNNNNNNNVSLSNDNNIYDYINGNATLAKAYMIIYLGDITQASSNGYLHFVFNGDPFYDYHSADHIQISAANRGGDYSSIQPDTAYKIILYTPSDVSYDATYRDFVIVWADSVHTHLGSGYWANFMGGQIEVQPLNNISGVIKKVVLVLQFIGETETTETKTITHTIVWDNPVKFKNENLYFTFNQNFNPF